jgi:2-polyprenyl-3-methyl-5-hydroxy-6-metoxy-1,4-benzoquinol methylase
VFQFQNSSNTFSTVTIIDKLLQRWRINKAAKYIPEYCLLLDVGCHQGEMLFLLHKKIKHGVGIDPLCTTTSPYKNIELLVGKFPEMLSNTQQFNAITALALVEHIPEQELPAFFQNCYHHLLPNGRLICTIPDEKVDKILSVLTRWRLVKGMSLEEHHGFKVEDTPKLAAGAGFQLLKHSQFQLGMNNLFVFHKPAA